MYYDRLICKLKIYSMKKNVPIIKRRRKSKIVVTIEVSIVTNKKAHVDKDKSVIEVRIAIKNN